MTFVALIVPATPILPVPVISLLLRLKSPPSCGVVSSTTLEIPLAGKVANSRALPPLFTLTYCEAEPKEPGVSDNPVNVEDAVCDTQA